MMLVVFVLLVLFVLVFAVAIRMFLGLRVFLHLLFEHALNFRIVSHCLSRRERELGGDGAGMVVDDYLGLEQRSYSGRKTA